VYRASNPDQPQIYHRALLKLNPLYRMVMAVDDDEFRGRAMPQRGLPVRVHTFVCN